MQECIFEYKDAAMFPDVPSPVDLRNKDDALEWANTAMIKRPWRTEFFDAFLLAINNPNRGATSRILELGSGPAYLAEHVLKALPEVSYVALDFSSAMHDLARQRLGALANRVEFVERSFKGDGWTAGLGQFDWVITNQAVHELRHKGYAPELHRQVRDCLKEGGAYLVCDHYAGEGGMANDQLYMSVDEQRQALEAAGFSSVSRLLLKGGMVLHEAC